MLAKACKSFGNSHGSKYVVRALSLGQPCPQKVAHRNITCTRPASSSSSSWWQCAWLPLALTFPCLAVPCCGAVSAWTCPLLICTEQPRSTALLGCWRWWGVKHHVLMCECGKISGCVVAHLYLPRLQCIKHMFFEAVAFPCLSLLPAVLGLDFFAKPVLVMHSFDRSAFPYCF